MTNQTSNQINMDELTIGLGNAHWTKPEPEDYVIYVGRGHEPRGCHYDSGLGNPFTVEEFGRDKAIKLYDVWLEDSMLDNLVAKIEQQYHKGYRNFVLMCWCIPNKCHAEIIRKRVFEILSAKHRVNNTDLSDYSDYCLHSGGAYGADTLFGQYCKEYGIKENHYYCGERSKFNAPNGNVHISQEDLEEGRYKVAQAAKYIWGYQYETMKDERLIRNWSQVKYADCIYAVANAVNEGEPVGNSFRDTRTYLREFVSGGTGYAVAMAILHNKPVYFYAQNLGCWFEYDYNNQEFEACGVPKLCKQFAGIGTRNLNEKGEQAIYELFMNTFGEPNN